MRMSVSAVTKVECSGTRRCPHDHVAPVHARDHTAIKMSILRACSYLLAASHALHGGLKLHTRSAALYCHLTHDQYAYRDTCAHPRPRETSRSSSTLLSRYSPEYQKAVADCVSHPLHLCHRAALARALGPMRISSLFPFCSTHARPRIANEP